MKFLTLLKIQGDPLIGRGLHKIIGKRCTKMIRDMYFSSVVQLGRHDFPISEQEEGVTRRLQGCEQGYKTVGRRRGQGGQYQVELQGRKCNTLKWSKMKGSWDILGKGMHTNTVLNLGGVLKSLPLRMLMLIQSLHSASGISSRSLSELISAVAEIYC